MTLAVPSVASMGDVSVIVTDHEARLAAMESGTEAVGTQLTLRSDATPNTGRLLLQTYEETSGTDSSEVIRISSLTEAAKGAIAWYADPLNARSSIWIQAHKYLHIYNAVAFLPAKVSVGGNTIQLVPTGNSYTTGLGGQFTTTGVLPSGLSLLTTYYLSGAGGIWAIYSDAALSSRVTLLDQGTGTHTFTPDLTTNNNLHQHFSIEASDSTGAKQTRLSIPFGYDTTEMGVFSANFNVNAGKLRVYSDVASFKELQFGNTPTSNLTPDGSTIRWSVRQDNSAESGAGVGSDFRIVRYSDAGAAVDQPLFIKRSNGQVGIGNNISPGASLDVGPFSAGAGTQSVRVNRGANSNLASYTMASAGADKWALRLHNDSTDQFHLRDAANGKTVLLATPDATAPSLQLFSATAAYGGGKGVLGIANASTVPSTNPTGGGVLYVTGGALAYRGSSGTVTPLAPA